MKYARKVTVIVLVIVFIIAFAISSAVATRIKNINITYNEKTGEGYDAYDRTYENLQSLKGGNIFLLSVGDVDSCVSDNSRLNLVSFKKSFPCTLEIVISERVETFYSYSDGICYVYDEDGSFMYSTDDIIGGTEENGFVVSGTEDLSPNVIIDYDLSQAEINFIAEAAEAFKHDFGSLRGLVKKIYREITPDSKQNLIFILRSGIEIDIIDCGNYLEEKIAQAYSNYLTISDGQKSGGKIRVDEQGETDGDVRSVYIP